MLDGDAVVICPVEGSWPTIISCAASRHGAIHLELLPCLCGTRRTKSHLSTSMVSVSASSSFPYHATTTRLAVVAVDFQCPLTAERDENGRTFPESDLLRLDTAEDASAEAQRPPDFLSVSIKRSHAFAKSASG